MNAQTQLMLPEQPNNSPLLIYILAALQIFSLPSFPNIFWAGGWLYFLNTTTVFSLPSHVLKIHFDFNHVHYDLIHKDIKLVISKVRFSLGVWTSQNNNACAVNCLYHLLKTYLKDKSAASVRLRELLFNVVSMLKSFITPYCCYRLLFVSVMMQTRFTRRDILSYFTFLLIDSHILLSQLDTDSFTFAVVLHF